LDGVGEVADEGIRSEARRGAIGKIFECKKTYSHGETGKTLQLSTFKLCEQTQKLRNIRHNCIPEQQLVIGGGGRPAKGSGERKAQSQSKDFDRCEKVTPGADRIRLESTSVA